MKSVAVRPTVLAYYFPNWHIDPRNEQWFGKGWSEWTLVESATPRFERHRQPRVPLDGNRDESLPTNAERDIDLARQHGINGFLVDYYWYDDGPYLDSALQDGLMKASNIDGFEFALMWANHNLTDIFPASEKITPQHLKNGAVDRRAFDELVEELVEVYFAHPSYLTIEGRPWFSIYEIGRFIEGLGGVDAARGALLHLDQRARDRGFPGVHLDAVVWGIAVLPQGIVLDNPGEILTMLGFRSATSYVWTHHSDLSQNTFPVGDWAKVRNDAFDEYVALAENLSVPLYPNVTVGWDSSPRTATDSTFVPRGYPWTSVFDPGPTEFEVGLQKAAEFLDETAPPHPIITVNAWNEWTEGSYLLPDTTFGTSYLEMIRKTFGR